MKKELKDYLHFYLGCECVIRLFNRNYSENVVLDGAVLERVKSGIIFKISPILRPLSDMNYEEQSAANRIWIDHNKNEAFYYETHYLLSKHFDLFGLIDASLAIDATTIKAEI